MLNPTAIRTVDTTEARLKCLQALERKVLWLAMWTIHNANHLRPKLDGLKVGGHQASSASVVTMMTALYFDVLKPQDRVAVKPHASPVFHAIQYLSGKQQREALEGFRSFGGAQSYSSRTKDHDDVDFSTGSVGLPVALTSFAALVQDYVRLKGFASSSEAPGRMVAFMGDAEFDEGNIFESMLEGWKHDVRNVWWIVDYNRQSLDGIASDRLYNRFDSVFRDMDWDVVTLKYGSLLRKAFAARGGEALREWLDDCPNSTYSILANRGGNVWRSQLLSDLGDTSGIRELLDQHDDAMLHRLMTNLGGHDLPSILDAFHGVEGDRPTCFISYSIKGYGLPFAAHKDNHAGLMTPEQMEIFRKEMNIGEGEEWDHFTGLDVPAAELADAIASAPFNQPAKRRHTPPVIPVPEQFEVPRAPKMSTQEGFGRIVANIGRQHPELSDRIVTTAPDVTVSTNLGAWVNRKGVFDRSNRGDVFADAQVMSPQKWALSPQGQHIELGIAESNLFSALAALGLSGSLFGARLLPIGTLYDPFICRGLDSLNYACYSDARFMLVATPAGLTLAPEGGAHQSIITPLIGMGQPSLTMYEPAYIDELAEIMRWSFEHMQAEKGGSVYLRLSTRPLEQPERELTPAIRDAIIEGAYWLVEPGQGAELAIVAQGALLPEALDAHKEVIEDVPGAGLLVVTAPGRLHREWLDRQRKAAGVGAECAIERMLAPLSPNAGLVTVIDGHPATLSWLGSVRRQRVMPLGVERFGQSGNLPDLYREYRLDADAILDAAARHSAKC